MLLLKMVTILIVFYVCMNRFINWWDNGFKVNHLEELNMSYSIHLWGGIKIIGRLLKVLFKMIIHSILPFVFEDTGWKDLGK